MMYVVERHPNGSSRTVPAIDVFKHLNQANIKVTYFIPCSYLAINEFGFRRISYDELCRLRRVLSTEAEGRGG